MPGMPNNTLPSAVQKWRTDRDAVCVVDSAAPKKVCIRWGCTLAPTGEYHSTVRVWQWCGLFVNLLWALVIVFIDFYGDIAAVFHQQRLLMTKWNWYPGKMKWCI